MDRSDCSENQMMYSEILSEIQMTLYEIEVTDMR